MTINRDVPVHVRPIVVLHFKSSRHQKVKDYIAPNELYIEGHTSVLE